MRRVEVNEKHLIEAEREQFRLAKGVEVANFLAARAFETLPEHLRVDASRAIRMRWILNWKRKDDGSTKAKARAVLLGYQDPDYEHRSTTSPTTTCQTRQIQLQIAASMGFTTEKGDMTGAFLQSRPHPTDLHCVPCKEICEAMFLPENSVGSSCEKGLLWIGRCTTRVVYVDLRVLPASGFSKVLVRPLLLDLRARPEVSRSYMELFQDMLTGSSKDPTWIAVKAAIQKEFQWSDRESKKFTQCRVLIEENEDGSYFFPRNHT